MQLQEVSESPFALRFISFLIFGLMWGASQRLAHSFSPFLLSDSYLSVTWNLTVGWVSGALTLHRWLLSDPETGPELRSTEVSKVWPYCHNRGYSRALLFPFLSLSLSHFLTLVSVKSCTISQNGDRWKKREKSQRKLTVSQMTEVNSFFIRKRGPNHKEDVEWVSPSQPGEELIS